MMQRAGLLPEEEAAQIREFAYSNQCPLVEVIVDRGVATEEALVKFIQSKLMIPEVEADLLGQLEHETVRHLPAAVAWSHEVLPVSVDSVGNMTVAMSDPTDLRAVDAVSAHTGAYLIRAVAPLTPLRRALERYYGPRPATGQPLEEAAITEAAAPAAQPAAAPPVHAPVATPPVEPPVAAPPAQPAVAMPPVQAPPVQAPPVQAPPVQAPAVQAPAVQAPAVQAPAVQAPVVQAPAVPTAPPVAPPAAEPAPPTAASAPPPEAPTPPATPSPASSEPAPAPPARSSGVALSDLRRAAPEEDKVAPLSPAAFTRVLPNLVAAADRDEITRVLLDFLAEGFSRVIMFVHLQQQLRGRDARGDDLMLEAVTQVRIPTTGGSLFRDVLERGTPHFGPWRSDTKVNRAFDQAMGGIRGNVLLLPVRLRERVPLLVYASGTHHPVDPRSLNELVDGVSGALERLIFRRKSQDNVPKAEG